MRVVLRIEVVFLDLWGIIPIAGRQYADGAMIFASEYLYDCMCLSVPLVRVTCGESEGKKVCENDW